MTPVDDEFAGHTPEPWVVSGDADLDTIVITTAGSGWSDIAHLGRETPTRRANARLIAAAPRLLRERDEARAKQVEWEQAVNDQRHEIRALQARINEGLEAKLTRERDEAWRATDRLEAVLREYRDELTEAESDVRMWVGWYNEARAEVKRVSDANTPLRLQRDTAVAEVAGLNAALAAAQRERDEAQADLAALEEQAESLWRNLGWNRSRGELGIQLDRAAQPLLDRVRCLEADLAKGRP